MYSISAYGSMIADSVRTESYAQALRAALTADSVVVDIGTGPGIFALLAAKWGARRVYAIEPADVIQLAREMAVANGCAERIEFIQGLSTEVTLPEQADIVLAEIHGILPLFQKLIPTLVDARKRLLKPGGTLIPQSERLWATVAEVPETYSRYEKPWTDSPYGLNMQAARQRVVNSWGRCKLTPQQCIVEPRCWATLDYRSIEDPNVRGEISWTVEKNATGHGLAVWFDTDVTPGIRFSNGPGKPELIFGKAFFPWPVPVSLAPGDVVTVILQATLVGEDYVWCWNSRVLEQVNHKQVKASFTQSSFFAEPLSPAELAKHAADHIPIPNKDGQVDQFILGKINGSTSHADIAHQVARQFPEQFAKSKDALDRVIELALKYSR